MKTFREWLRESELNEDENKKYVVFYYSMKSDSDRTRIRELNDVNSKPELFKFKPNDLFNTIALAKNDVKEEIAYVKKSNKYAEKSTIAWKKDDLNNKVAHIWSVKEVENGYNLVKHEAVVHLKW